MLPQEIESKLSDMLEGVEHPREKVVDVMYVLQNHFGHLCDEAVEHAARFTGMAEVEVEELATFYDFIYREPVGRFVIHVCDGVVCWMHHEDNVFRHLCDKLGVEVGQTTEDGMFTLLPSVCIGHCDQAPAMLVNGRLYGPLTPEMIDDVLEDLRTNPERMPRCR